jgi:hypothetical protein
MNFRRKSGTALLQRGSAPVDVGSPSSAVEAGVDEARAVEAGVVEPRSVEGEVQPSGVFTKILINHLEKLHSTDDLTELLRRTGDNRSLDEFKEAAGSTSIDQFARLRTEANSLFGPDVP